MDRDAFLCDTLVQDAVIRNLKVIEEAAKGVPQATRSGMPEDNGTVKIYCGGADTVMCAGTAVIDDLVDLCLAKPRPAL